MYKGISKASARCVAFAFVLIVFASVCASAQVSPAPQPSPSAIPSPSPTPQAKPAPSLESHFVKNVLDDQRAIWLSPFHVGRGDAKWLLPVGGAAALMFATDRRTGGEAEEGGGNPTRVRISNDISQLGSFYATGGIAAAFYFVGRAKDDARARETGLLGAEALVDSGIVVTALKSVARRQRPTTDNASGEFFSGGTSFPSGHSISAWSLAAVVAGEYGQHRPALRFTIYGLAAAVSLSRYGGRNHFLSDVLVGSVIGYGTGRYVYLKRHDPTLDGEKKPSVLHSKYFPAIAPRFGGDGGRDGREYGVALAWGL
ncbi:MAG TPA: phosphatase PAP2 family protein [Pyrinomonadaceae bacterium]|jgi:membrane-associated phospholipid phosphatase|nr:phosphatase PAP2 family protein [Pyrinomonadaceae bacterium]